MRWLALVCIVASLGSCKEEQYFIPGTGTLPDCSEAPDVDLNGTVWFDQGTVLILTTGCADAEPDAMFVSCALNWVFTQNGNEVGIVVDEEYRIEGRVCGDQLYLRGGWWLPVQDEGMCTYDEDSAAEVGIQAEGNVLTFIPADGQNGAQMSGTLSVRGACSAEYEVTFGPLLGF